MAKCILRLARANGPLYIGSAYIYSKNKFDFGRVSRSAGLRDWMFVLGVVRNCYSFRVFRISDAMHKTIDNEWLSLYIFMR